MSLFHRRNKVTAHSIQTRHGGPPQVSAAAASAAKLAASKSTTSLSAAAAAAALQKNPAPPTDVANVQTKRIERRNSGSSTGSPRPGSRPGLERRTSLTERTLRSPSPGRNDAPRQGPNPPPMPPLPPGVERTPSGRHRAASLEGPRRIASPPPAYPGGRGMSLDRAGRTQQPVTKATAKAPPQLSQLNEQVETQPRTSVNFSRPISPPPKSPTSPVPTSQGGTGWFAGAVTSGAAPRKTMESLEPEPSILTSAEASGIQSHLTGVSDQPVKKKKKRKKNAAHGNEGQRLSEGSMIMTGTAVEAARAIVDRQNTTPETPSSPASSVARSSIESDRSDTHVQESSRSRLGRQPSMIDEAPELEQVPERANTGKKVEGIPPMKSTLRATISTPEPAPVVQPVSATVPVEAYEPKEATVQRTSSLSPQRSARFSTRPEYLGLTQHQPLGRSASPAKSALKHSPSSSVRTASPDMRFSGGTSDVSMADSSVSRKKSNRVSFDETPHILTGLQSSRFADHSPQYNDLDDNLDDIMKPRPALPSFGSVRGRKDDTIETPTTGSRALAHSSDHGVGGVLAHDFASRKLPSAQPHAITTHDPMLPLPPDVTTVEGTGYASDSESEYSDHPAHHRTSQPHSPQREMQQFIEKEPEPIAENAPALQTSDTAQPAPVQNGTVAKSAPEPAMLASTSSPIDAPPAIAVQPATPVVEEEQRRLTMPGGFEWDDDVEAQPAPEPVKDTTPAAVPQMQAQPAESMRQTHSIPAALRIEDDSETESDNSSIWSDAEEDLPSGPGGFASLNAIVDSPQAKNEVPDLALPGLGLSKHAVPLNTTKTVEDAPPSPTAAQWNQTTAYWRGLSEQKKMELEAQAMGKKEQDMEQSETEDGSTEEESDMDEDMEKTLVEPLPRPVTPPQKAAKPQPKLASPIALGAREAPVTVNPKKEPKLRSSMRQSSATTSDGDDEAPRMKKTMRSSMRNSVESTRSSKTDGEHHLRSSMRGAPPASRPEAPRRHSSGLEESRWSQPQPARAVETLTNGRPRTAGAASPATKPALKKSTVTAPAPAPAAPTLRRQNSDDSVSSFRRQRNTYQGGMTMRRSMRDAQALEAEVLRPQSPPEKKRGGLFRLRSLSPQNRQPETASPKLQKTMRPTSPTPSAPTMRTKEPAPKKASRFKSPTRLGFGKSKNKSPPESPQATRPTAALAPTPAVTPAAVASSPPFKSRISADSDDDDDVPRAQFVSRFADSDDEPESPVAPLKKTLTPVRGIPKASTADDGDSTDLEDSDNERVAKHPPVPSTRDIDDAHGKRSHVLTNGNRPASILSAGSLRKGSASTPAAAPDSGLAASRFATGSSSQQPGERPQQKRRLSWLGLGGSAKRSNSLPPISVTGRPASSGGDKPKLLRRSTPTGLPQITEGAPSDWPLASSSAADEAQPRPSTSDGPGTALKAGTMRPDVGKRRSTTDYIGGESGLTTTIEGGERDGEGSGGRKKVGFNFESGEPVYSERTGRKKRFGGLRKMFGLVD